MAHYLALFTLGMLAATIAVSRDQKWMSLKKCVPWGMIVILLSLGLIIMHKILGWEAFAAKFIWTDFIIGICTSALLIYASDPKKTTWPLNTRLFTWIGTFAYSLYLIHAPLLQVIWQYALQPMRIPGVASYLLMLIIGLPVIVLISYIFYLVCERPFITKQVSIVHNQQI